jgi:hypothetical protein
VSIVCYTYCVVLFVLPPNWIFLIIFGLFSSEVFDLTHLWVFQGSVEHLFFQKSYFFHIAFLIAIFTHSSPPTIIFQTELSVARLPFTFHFSCLSYFYISWSSQPPLSFHIIVSNCLFIYLLSYSKKLGSLSPTCSVVWISIVK